MEHKNVTNTARIIIGIYNIGLFVLIWNQYYNKYAFQKFWFEGEVLSIIIYVLIYISLCQLYKGFRIASYSIIETGLSQFISFGIADFMLYMECCLTSNRYISILPGAGIVILQAVGTFVMVLFFKRYFINHVPPKSTVLIYGSSISSEEIEDYKERISAKYNHLFLIKSIKRETEFNIDSIGTINEYHTVMLYEVNESYRKMAFGHCLKEGQSIYFTPAIEDILVASSEAKHLIDTPLLKYSDVYRNTFYTFLKRLSDIIISLVLLVITSPIVLIAAIAIKLEDKGPVIFKQTRCTLNERKFNIYKLRSMVVHSEKENFKPCTANDVRITKAGRVIRKFRIDEIPQLFNVFKGDMSLVGPRPERIEHVEKYDELLPQFRLRARVKAGITGYAQIYGKYNTSAYDKLRLDLMYIENQSIILDVKLLLLTIKIIFVPESSEGFTEKKSEEITKRQYHVIDTNMAATAEIIENNAENTRKEEYQNG